MLDRITPLLITYNEAPNIGRTLAKLAWARRIVVIDSGSTDATLAMVRRLPQADVIHRPFDSFAQQCNFGLDQIAGGWVLSLDADYVLSDELVREIELLSPADPIAGFSASFVYVIHGRKLRASLYPPRTVLYRRDRARYRDEGHGHRVAITGEVLPLSQPIYHDDRKSLDRWFAAQRSYARVEAAHLLALPRDRQTRNDRLRLMAWPAPLLVLVYTLFVKRAILDGWPGWFYALQRLLAETALALELIERRATADEPPA